MGRKTKAEKARDEAAFDALCRREEEVRWHEAGHALVALALGRGIICVEVWAAVREDGESFGGTQGVCEYQGGNVPLIARWLAPEASPAQRAKGIKYANERMLISVAGKAAEMVLRTKFYQPDREWAAYPDWREVIATAELLHLPPCSWDVEDDDDCAARDSHDAALWSRYVVEETRRVYRWLTRHREQLAAIAEGLDDAGWVLSGEDVDRILARLPPIRRPQWDRARMPSIPVPAAT